jgi:trigger factor
MKVNVKRTKDCKVQMLVEVDADTAEGRYLEVMREFQRAAHLPGFREGKAPLELIEKRYQDQAREEVLKSLIPEVYHRSVQDQKVAPVSLPKISDVKYQRGQKLVFNAEFEESPSVSVRNYKGLALKRVSSEVTDDELEKGIQSLLESRATFDPVLETRPVKQGDFITVDIELWKDGAYEKGRSGVLLSVEPGAEDDFFDKAVGANVGDVREIVRQGQPFTRLKVKGIHNKSVPCLDEEFAKTLGQQSADEIRDSIRKELASYKHADSMEKMKQELFQKLLKMVNFSLPESLVEQQKGRLIEQARRRYAQRGVSEEDWKAKSPGLEDEMVFKAKEQVKIYFILQKISELEKIEPDEFEIVEKIKKLCEQSGRPLEEARRVFEDDFRESTREKMTVDFLIAHAKFES